jgi:hypothetical protein
MDNHCKRELRKSIATAPADGMAIATEWETFLEVRRAGDKAPG